MQRYMLFIKKETHMTFRYIAACLAALVIFLSEASAGPVQKARQTFSQPDGTLISVITEGDEWFKITTTSDGCAIVKDADGWWCYGTYDENGLIENTGYRIGTAPADIVAASRNIPYHKLAERAKARRSVGLESMSRALEWTRSKAVRTKSDGGTVLKKGIILLVEFSDIKFSYKKEDFVNLLNQKGYNGTGSAKDYYEDQFGEGWEFDFEVSDIITLSWPSEHYGRNGHDGSDSRPWDMVAEACREADGQIDFSQYDQDEDGEVDNVFVFYAGMSEAEHSNMPDLIWPHQYYIYSGEGINLKCDGKRIDRYACAAEISGTRSLTGIGSFCHEFAHTLGLMDLYDTDYDEDGGWAAGTWKRTSLMDGGNYNNDSATPPNFNCIEREILGLSYPVMIEAGGTYMLDPIHKNGAFCRMETDTENEYYLFECRSNEGWDAYIGGQGMLVYHIDRNATEKYLGTEISKWQLNTINTDQFHQCVDLIEADGRSDLIMGSSDFSASIKGIFFPQDRVTALSPETTPALTFWSGKEPEISISGIRMNGENIMFKAVNTAELFEIPYVTDAEYTTFPDAAIITFKKSDIEAEGVPRLEWRKSGSKDEYTVITPVEYYRGRYSCKIEGLESGSISYETKIRFENEGGIGDVYKRSFMTKRKPMVDWAYIYINNSEILEDSSIALHVVNADGQVSWKYNGEDISPADGHHFYPTEDGELQAVVEKLDGSCDIIIKQIKLIR